MENIPRVFAIHVQGNHERREHIEKEFKKKALTFELILKGNQEDLNDKVLKKYFLGSMREISPRTSCCYKHLLAYQKMASEKVGQALIFEDDIILYKNFITQLNQVLLEVKQKNLKNYLISLEDYSLRVITDPKKNQFLYRKKSGRCAGAYLIDHEFAHNFLNFIKKKCHLPIDWMHNLAAQEGIIAIYWAHPSLCEQKSHNGDFDSLLDLRVKKGLLRKLNHYYKKYIKKKFYSLFKVEM